MPGGQFLKVSVVIYNSWRGSMKSARVAPSSSLLRILQEHSHTWAGSSGPGHVAKDLFSSGFLSDFMSFFSISKGVFGKKSQSHMWMKSLLLRQWGAAHPQAFSQETRQAQPGIEHLLTKQECGHQEANVTRSDGRVIRALYNNFFWVHLRWQQGKVCDKHTQQNAE